MDCSPLCLAIQLLSASFMTPPSVIWGVLRMRWWGFEVLVRDLPCFTDEMVEFEVFARDLACFTDGMLEYELLRP